MMDVSVEPSFLSGRIGAPASKSYLHRILICSAFSSGNTHIKGITESEDVSATADCLRALGSGIEFSGGTAVINPGEGCRENPLLNCRESGSTFRFMLPVAAVLGVNATLIGSDRLGKRPIAPLCRALENAGADIKCGEKLFPLSVSGRANAKSYRIDASVSSQFISGLMLAVGIAGGGSIITENKPASLPYIRITKEVMELFGAGVAVSGNTITVSGGYISPKTVSAPCDWSNGAFFIAAGALGGNIEIDGLNQDDMQGDKVVTDILRSMGARISTNGCVKAEKSCLTPTETDCDNFPDLVPVLCVAACGAKGKSVFKNIKRLREKESDRVETTVNMIRALGGEAYTDGSTITIIGNGFLSGGTVDCANDHRIAMCGAVASTIAKGRIILKGAQAVNKSYPRFFEDFAKLGGKLI